VSVKVKPIWASFEALALMVKVSDVLPACAMDAAPKALLRETIVSFTAFFVLLPVPVMFVCAAFTETVVPSATPETLMPETVKLPDAHALVPVAEAPTVTVTVPALALQVPLTE